MTTRATAAAPPDTPQPRAYEPGNEHDFARLYNDCWGRVLAALVPILRDRAAAEDCAQEAFVRAFRAWDRWTPDAPAEVWLQRIAINVAINARKRERLREVGEVLRRLGRPADAPDPQETAERGDIVAALRKLPPKQSAALVLRHLHGYTNREIAEALGVPERTVASRLAAARKRLQEELGGEADGPRIASVLAEEGATRND